LRFFFALYFNEIFFLLMSDYYMNLYSGI